MSRPFGAKLRAARKRLGLSQTALAHLLNINPSTLSNLESGRRPASLALAVSLAQYLGVSADYFLRDEIPVEPDPDTGKPLIVRERRSSYAVESFGNRLRRQRLAAGLLQAELAKALGLTSHAHISYIENGHKEPSIELLIQIADYFEVSVDDLVLDTSLATFPDEQSAQ